VAALTANVYIVGLNQLTDVDIDRVNKPELPLPAGALSRAAAATVVALCGATAIAVGLWAGSGDRWLVGTLAAALVIGSVYSLPPLRLKSSIVGAPLSIALVRGPIVTLGLYAHFSSTLGAGSISRAWIVLLAAFMTLFGMAIGVAKDLPDVRGDRAHGVSNVASEYGPERARTLTVWLLVAAYALTLLLGLELLPLAAALVLAATHLSGAYLVWRWGSRSNMAVKGEARLFYRRVWTLLYVEAVMIPLLGILSAAFE
jgi:homogentisate phytyltransferase/homogentisate geranylgeranyltransferase